MQNLREKLLKAGLVSAEQAKQAEGRLKADQARSPRPAERSRQAEDPAPPEPRLEGRIPRLPPLPGSRDYQRLQSKKQLELDRRIRELVVQAAVPLDPGDETFHFVTRKGRLRRLDLTPAQHNRLEKGELAVVERPDPGQIEHALVPASAADLLLALSAKAVRFFNKPGSAVGFLTDEELKDRQVAEASMPPEAPDGAGDADRGDGEAEASAEAAGGEGQA